MTTEMISKCFERNDWPNACDNIIELSKSGGLSASAFQMLFKRACLQAYPAAKSEGHAMQAFMDTTLGRSMLAAGISLEKRGGRGTEPFAMASDNPASSQQSASTPEIEDGDEDTTSNAREEFATGSKADPNEVRGRFARYAKEMIAAHAAQNQISHHHAIDDLLKTSPYFRQILNASKLSA